MIPIGIFKPFKLLELKGNSTAMAALLLNDFVTCMFCLLLCLRNLNKT